MLARFPMRDRHLTDGRSRLQAGQDGSWAMIAAGGLTGRAYGFVNDEPERPL